MENQDWQPVNPRYFQGQGRLRIHITEPEINVGAVEFQPGCRNNWHTHPVSQTLIVTAGEGIYQEEGKPAQLLRTGDIVHTAANINHWHGATATAALTHIAITLPDAEGELVTWGKPVDETTYDTANTQLATEKAKVTAGRDRLGTFAPKFAQLNDDILFGEVWSRTAELSARDRSLITITALIANGINDSSLEHHLRLAKQNGITQTEIAEILTHLAFYAGWPKAWATFNEATTIWKEEQ